MEKSICKAVTTASLLLVLFSLKPVQAQEGAIQIGPGLVYGNQVERLGLKADGTYSINEIIRAAADFTLFFPEKTDLGGGNELTATWMALNFNAHYFFYSQDELSAYGIGGLNISILRASISGTSDSESELGLNLGAGVEYVADFGNLFGELTLAGIAGDADQLVIGGGVRFPL